MLVSMEIKLVEVSCSQSYQNGLSFPSIMRGVHFRDQINEVRLMGMEQGTREEKAKEKVNS